MSAYELDDELVRRVASGRTTADDQDDLFRMLAEQIPIPLPAKIGAIVRTESEAFLRADGSTTPWICIRMPGVAFVERPDWLADAQLGRVIEVLSEGVDL